MAALPFEPMMTGADKTALMRRATQASVIVAVILILLKSYAYFISDSLAMLGSLLDSGLDGLASLVNLLAIRHATTPADSDHRFGHEKAEPLAGLGQTAFILGSAVFLAVEAVQHLINPLPLQNIATGLAVSVLAITLIIALLIFQHRVIRRTGSLLIRADALHYRSDLLTNVAVIVSLAATARWNLPAIDAAVGLGIAFIIGHSATVLFRQAYDQLMDREAPDLTRNEIKALALRNSEVRAVHELRTRMAGTRIFVQLHLELDPAISLLRAHHISDDVEAEILKFFPGAEVIIHQDPAGYEKAPEVSYARS